MKRGRLILFYSSTILALLLLIAFVLHKGSSLGTSAIPAAKPASAGTAQLLHDAFQTPFAVLLLQLISIVLATRICGWLFRKIGQPAVVGEIAAGIVLGPSVIGSLAPQFSALVFPRESLGHLKMLSQVGLILFMFVIGMELDLRSVREKAGAAVVISHSSIVLPYGLGVVLALFIYERYAAPGTPFFAFALFMGIAMSITAFPVLAKMIRERGLSGTRLGNIALTCAAADDVSAWCILALVLAMTRAGSIGSSWQTLLLALLFIALMLGVVKPALRAYAARRHNAVLQQGTVALVFLVLLGSAWCSEAIGIHALFGAFLAGVVMPAKGGFRQALIQKTEDVALVLLLPLFFAFTGLNTEIGLLSTPAHWMWCGIITAVAVAGKLGGTYLAARIAGESHSGSLALGALMNTRGLMELVVLNIGLELHILSPAIFAMMVLMALATTLMTSPLLKLAGIGKPERPGA